MALRVGDSLAHRCLMTADRWRHAGVLFAEFVLIYAMFVTIVGIASVLARMGGAP